MNFSKDINDWKPYYLLNTSDDNRLIIINYIKKVGWSRNKFHDYFKRIEELLLLKIQDMININLGSYEVNSPKKNKKIKNFWCDMELQWEAIALLRDFHDYMCGRDKKHNIRTDDCYRFIHGIRNGIATKKFIKPVCRILCGETSSRKFTHPLFTQFN
jgi:hypothetical protein